ncbi:hypothetical protein QFC24_000388 [Naganishia onofrii]|uniref:Uncharacterized protein n=1 Tax=Naganishia onofrii TaxID=1851511 RepID=A0ACC2XXJ1_9TREE|nr:hypothetical protein QFC24_000388 [Naganishia onofrii]
MCRFQQQHDPLPNTAAASTTSSPGAAAGNTVPVAGAAATAMTANETMLDRLAAAEAEERERPCVFKSIHPWMHNGSIADFQLIKRKLQSCLSEELFLHPSGYTDSEWAFALFLSKVRRPPPLSFPSPLAGSPAPTLTLAFF